MDKRFLLLQLCFFLSGFAGLLYETAWTREFAFVFGTSELAVSAVLAAYMAGLALGAAVAARIAPRIRRPVLAYGVIELGVGLGALVVPFAIRGLMSLYVHWLGGLSDVPEEVGLFTALFHLLGAFIVLVPCTALMGATLPLLARHAVQAEDQIGPRVGLLYAVNTGGAICGALTAAFIFLPAMGLRYTIYAGAALNGLVFLAAAALARAVPASTDVPTGMTRGPFLILPLIAVSGMVSFIYEVLWVRLLAYVLGGSTAAFATMLSSFLLGIALGSALASPLARKASRAATGFAVVQVGTALFAVLTFALVGFMPQWSSQLGASPQNLLPGALLSVLILLPVTVCIGATFPFAVRILTVDADDVASSTARVYAWNTLGSIVGSVGAGFFLLPRLGFEGTLALGAVLNVLLALTAALSLTRGARSLVLSAAAIVAGLSLVWFKPAPPDALMRISSLTGSAFAGELEYVGVGRSGTVSLLKTAHSWRVVTNGLPESAIQTDAVPPDQFQEARWLSLLPLLVRPDIRNVLLIGLGGGNTLGAVPHTVDEIDLIELEPEVVAANRRVGSERSGGNPLDDPRLFIRYGDARGALMLADTQYDAIVSQPSHPWTSGASHLYTHEFFEMARDRLAPGGVFVQWMGLAFVNEDLFRGLVATLGDVFEHVMVFRPKSAAVLFVASNEPFDLVETAARAISLAPDELAGIGVAVPEDVVATLILDSTTSRTFSAGAERITDDWNRLAWMKSDEDEKRGSIQTIMRSVENYLPTDDLGPELDLEVIAQRFVASRRSVQLNAVLESVPEAQRQRILGWSSIESRQYGSAIRHFVRALQLDPDSVSGRVGMAMVKPEGASLEGLPPHLVALVRAQNYGSLRQWERVRELEPELASVPRGSLFSRNAEQLRIGWRMAESDPELAEEVLDIIDRQIVRGSTISDLWTRAEASARAGQTDFAWASLQRLAERLRRSESPGGLARRALRLSQQLPPAQESQQTIAILRALARGSG